MKTFGRATHQGPVPSAQGRFQRLPARISHAQHGDLARVLASRRIGRRRRSGLFTDCPRRDSQVINSWMSLEMLRHLRLRRCSSRFLPVSAVEQDARTVV